MRAGSLNGRGDIYDNDGHLILRPEETLVRVVPRAIALVLPRWGRLVRGRAVIDTYAGEGSWFVTDRRMVFIRKPDSKGARRWLRTPTTFPDGVEEVLRVRQVRREGGFDYCEILYDEVRFYKKYRKNGKLLLMVSGVKYQMHANDGLLQAALPFLKQRGIEQR